MRTVSAVIGANFGDEGKGLVTDYLASRNPKSTLVVRFNGGAQAGHTVVLPNGRRHVFHHLGSGSLAGAATYLGPKFLTNPMIFAEEYPTLRDVAPFEVYVHPDSPVSTPFDAMLNQDVEKIRGANRHGSCGLGIWETVLRNEAAPFTVKDLYLPTLELLDKLDWIREIHVPLRAKELGIAAPTYLQSHKLMDRFLRDIEFFIIHTTMHTWEPAFVSRWDCIIFEGAQGLRLDQDSRYLPHVSGSKTGLANVKDLVVTGGLQDEMVNAYYVTRPYITRHGAGPLPHEVADLPGSVVDTTNVYNEWQEQLRYGLFDVDEFAEFISREKREDLYVGPRLVVSCIDQVHAEMLRWFVKGKQREGRLEALVFDMLVGSGISTCYTSRGPTRDDIVLYS